MNASNSSCSIPPLTTSRAIDYFQACVALVLGIIGFLTNLLILVLVARYKKLQQRLMYLGLHIVVIDIVYTLTIPPVIFISGVAGEWLLGVVMCNILGTINDFFAVFRFFMTLVLAIDRFTSVFWPFFYERHSLLIMVPLLTIIYILSILRVVLPLSGVFSCFQFVPTIKTCTAFACSGECFLLVAISVSSIVFFGVIIPLVLYTVLFCKTWAVKRSLEKTSRPRSVRMTSCIAMITKSLTSEPLSSSMNSIGPCDDGGKDVVKEAFGSKSSQEPDSSTDDVEPISPPCLFFNRTLLTVEYEQQNEIKNAGCLEEDTVSISSVVLEVEGDFDCRLEQTDDDAKFESKDDTLESQSSKASITQSTEVKKDVAEGTTVFYGEGMLDNLSESTLAEVSPAHKTLEATSGVIQPPVSRQETITESHEGCEENMLDKNLSESSLVELSPAHRTLEATSGVIQLKPPISRHETRVESTCESHEGCEESVLDNSLSESSFVGVSPAHRTLEALSGVHKTLEASRGAIQTTPPLISRQETRVELQPLALGGRMGTDLASLGVRRGSAEVELANYHFRSRASTLTGSSSTENILKKVNKNTRMTITMFILLMSVIGCTTPAFVLYGVQFLYLEPQPTLFIVNMVLGRTCFNLLPIVDSIAIMRHREFKRSILRCFKTFRLKIWGRV